MSGINTAGAAYFDLDQTGTGQRLLVRQIMVNISVAPSNAPSFYLARATVRGTQASTLAGQPLDENDAAAAGTLDVCASAAQPTFGNRMIVGGLAVTAGGVYIWSFWDLPVIVRNTAGYGLCVVNANASGGTTGTFTCSAVWDE